jgi:hypothetical protein
VHLVKTVDREIERVNRLSLSIDIKLKQINIKTVSVIGKFVASQQ